MCGTRGLGFKWPQWHAFLCERQVALRESGLPAGRKDDVSEASQDGMLEEMGSQARV